MLLKSHLGNCLSMPQTFQTTNRLTFHGAVCFNKKKKKKWGNSQFPGSLFTYLDLLMGKSQLKRYALWLGDKEAPTPRSCCLDWSGCKWPKDLIPLSLRLPLPNAQPSASFVAFSVNSRFRGPRGRPFMVLQILS